MERVTVFEGDLPVIVTAPHGVDDTNTDIIAEMIAKEMGAFAVINKGWKRSKEVDYWQDLANCNDIRHLHEDVLEDEFLNPILRYVKKIQKKYDEKVFILHLHGCSNLVKEIANDEDLDLIVGYGDGNPPSYSCNRKYKDAFIYHLQKAGFKTYEGKPGGNYSGKSKNNLNQLFRRWYADPRVNSLQLEIVQELRSEQELIELVVDGLMESIDSLMLFDDTTNLISKRVGKI